MKNWGIEPFEPENPIVLASAQIFVSFAEKAFCFPCSGTSADIPKDAKSVMQWNDRNRKIDRKMIAALYTEKWTIDWQKDLRHGLHSGVAPTINE